jgi:hypothetical protein
VAGARYGKPGVYCRKKCRSNQGSLAIDQVYLGLGADIVMDSITPTTRVGGVNLAFENQRDMERAAAEGNAEAIQDHFFRLTTLSWT